MLSSAPLAFVLSGAVHTHRGAMTALTERLLSLQREKWLCILHACRCRIKKQWCAEMLAPNSGQCAISALDAGDSCNSGSGVQHGVCAAVIVCSCAQCSVYNWRLNRLACLPSMLLTGVDALTVMVLPRVACMHHDPRLSYTRWQVSSCWC